MIARLMCWPKVHIASKSKCMTLQAAQSRVPAAARLQGPRKMASIDQHRHNLTYWTDSRVGFDTPCQIIICTLASCTSLYFLVPTTRRWMLRLMLSRRWLISLLGELRECFVCLSECCRRCSHGSAICRVVTAGRHKSTHPCTAVWVHALNQKIGEIICLSSEHRLEVLLVNVGNCSTIQSRCVCHRSRSDGW